MAEQIGIRVPEEYQTLREELLLAKKYVFERPLLILALGLGGINALEKSYFGVVLPVLAGILLFNFWFTANRLISAARIVAYIPLELEEGKYGRWVGWETCLRWYRKWLKTDPEKKKQDIDQEMDIDAIPDAMMYYPPIYQLHLVLIVLTTLVSFREVICNPTALHLVCAGATLAVLIGFLPYCIKYRPSIMRTLIERNRVIWGHVFKYMISKGKK